MWSANRELYRAKFAQVTPMLAGVLDVALPDAGLLPVGRRPRGRQGDAGDDVAFALGLLAQYNVAVLPGSLLARDAHGINPGRGRIRMALVAGVDECVEAAERIVSYTQSLLMTQPNCKPSSTSPGRRAPTSTASIRPSCAMPSSR